MTRATELFQIVSEKSRVSLQGTVKEEVADPKRAATLGHLAHN